MNKKLKLVDLCAGTGGFSLAFELTNKVKTVYANDFEPSSKLIYDKNFKCELDLKDIFDVNKKEIPKHDILTAGFPCQPFSVAGKQQGFDDERSNVFFKILEIIEYHTPECIVLENVKNLLTHDNGNTFRKIKKYIKNIGYKIKYKILDTGEITGIPQHRERLYIVCIKNKEFYDQFNFDFPTIKKQKISEFLENDIDDKYYYNNKDNKIHEKVRNVVVKKNVVYQYRRTHVRENKKNNCPTLTANMGSGGHNVPLIIDDYGARKLTPRECFNLQGFAEDYKLPKKLCDSKLYKLAGNAITVPVAKLIAEKLIEILYQDQVH